MGKTYKMFQIIFSKNDGSVFINFPYYKHSNGLVSLVTLKAGTKYPTSSELTTGGKITSHLVKYTHHPDGNAHFSQDKKVLTKIKKKSVPLKNIHGHFFTIMLQGVRDYTETKSINEYAYNKSKTQINYSINSEGLSALKFVGRYYNQNKIAQQIVGEVKGPIVPCQTDDGKKYIGFLIKHPFDNSTKDSVILLTCEIVPTLDKTNYSALTFIGGFDPIEKVYNHNIDTSFLALSYPVENYEELKNRIECIDYRV